MVRTNVIKLRGVEAVAHRFRLQDGGCGVMIIRKDMSDVGIAVVQRKTDEPILAKYTSVEKFTLPMFREAIKRTQGLPYSKVGQIRFNGNTLETFQYDSDQGEFERLVNSKIYQRIITYYTNSDGRFERERLNEDVIRLLNENESVRFMAESYHDVDVVRDYVLGYHFRFIASSEDVMSYHVVMIEKLLDLMYPGSCFRELNEELSKQVSSKDAFVDGNQAVV